MTRTATALLLAACAAGCLSGTKGVEPPRRELHFPSAALLTPGGRYLLIANSNFDLAWRLGTLLLVDLDAIEGRVRACPDEGCAPFEDTEAFIPEEETVLIGSYASFMSLSPDGSRVYMTVRGNNSLTVIDLDEAAGAGRKISCFDAGAGERECDARHVVSRSGGRDLPADPYALNSQLEEWVFVSHLTSSSVSLFKTDPAADIGRGLAPELVGVDTSLPDSVSSIVKHPAADLFYATSRSSSSVASFWFSWDPADAENEPRFSFGPSISMRGLADGDDARDLAFSPDGSLAFITNRSPNSVVIADSAVPAGGGWPENRVLDVVPLDQGPSLVTVWQPAGGDRYWVYATCYNADRVYVIDPELRAKSDTIATGDGPHVLVTDAGRNLGYLVNFIESSVSVIELDPASPLFNRIRATIGKPTPLKRND